ncbi:Hypothetical predicted protein, partial [Paramuricea clavata]
RLGGSRWTSGRTGPLTKTSQKSPGSKKNQSNGIVNKVPRKIKVLTDEPVESYIRKPPAMPARKSWSSLCGQCEKIASVWHCHDCSEKYCDGCFNQFHLRGALRKHTKTRVEAGAAKEITQQAPATARQEDSIFKSYGVTTETPTTANDHTNGPSLLNGSYDEEESANSFAQALQEWRNQNKAAKISPRNPLVCTDTSCGTSNESITHQDDKKELTIKFNSSISYGDRLYLKKNRENNIASVTLPGKVNESDKKGERAANKNEMVKDDGRSAVEAEGKENNEPVDHFAPNYREMIQNITTVKSNPDISGLYQEKNMPSRRAISVQEISPVEVNTHIDEGTACIVEECEEEESAHTRPISRHGAVTICEMYTSKDSEKDLEQATSTLDTHNYVSPAITSKPFFLKPTEKVNAKKQAVRTMSAGRKKTPRRDEQRKMLVNNEQRSPKLSSKKGQHGKELPLHQVINESSPVHQSNKSSKQLPLKNGKEETKSITNNLSPRPPSNKGPTKNKTQIPIREAWKPKPTHKELSSFFLAGVDDDSENLQRNEEVHSERSSSTPITNLGRGSLSSTWNPIESYPQISTPDSVDISSGMETSTLEEQHYQTSAASKERYSDEDDLQLTGNKFEELEVPQRGESKDNTKNNSSNEEEELLELKALDDFGTGDQDDDDLATLNDLAWELASSTGRLTRCEEDFHLDSDDDSIEDKDGGSGLSTPCTLERSFRESIMDDFEEMERKFMEEEF